MDSIGGSSQQGAAYVFRGLDTASGNKTQDLRLLASDAAANDYLGASVSLFGSSALAGAPGANANQGAAYLFRDVDTGTGNKTQDLKLIALDGAAGDYFGASASLSGSTALVGAAGATVGVNAGQGAAYVFRGINTGTGTKIDDLKLVASDGAAGDTFGNAASLSGTTALVGALNKTVGSNTGQGAAYVYRGIDTGTGTRTEDLKLTASDGAAEENFGYSVSLSGSTAIAGSFNATVSGNAGQGAAYLYRGLNTGNGSRTEDVKIVASDGAAGDGFGSSVALDGDLFAVGALGKSSDRGKVYTGSVSSITVLDEGNAAREIDQISFISRGDWVIGQTTSNNTVILSSGDSATVTAAGKGVYVGRNAGAHENRLTINGTLGANFVQVGNGANVNSALFVNGQVNAPVTMNSVTTLGGGGLINGTVTMDSHVQVTPGNSIGTLTTGSVTWAGNGAFDFEFKTDGTGAAGADWDQLVIFGSLALTGTANGTYTIHLYTMSDSTTPGALASWDPNVDHEWQDFITFTGGITGFASALFAFDTTYFANPLNGSFSVELNDSMNGLNLVYTAVPEPSAVSLALAGLALAGICRRFKRSGPSAANQA